MYSLRVLWYLILLLSIHRELFYQKLYLFGRYEYYDSYIPAEGTTLNDWTNRHRIAAGLNYYPIPEIVIKAEYSHRFLKTPYNPEPSVSLGVAWSGFFK